MSVSVSPVFLLDVPSEQAEAAELWDAITDRNIGDWEAEWVPVLLGALQRLHRAGVQRSLWPQSRHWDWRRKTEAIQGVLAYPGFSVVCQNVTQGLMLVDTTTKRCQLTSQTGKNLVYVWFVENAPWNRAELFKPPRFKGVGSILMRAAIDLSTQEGFQGRIGLHSLPQANGFYANKCGMTDMGVDPQNKEGLRYFEMTPAQAAAFIQKGGTT